jgi:hypothetical protein
MGGTDAPETPREVLGEIRRNSRHDSEPGRLHGGLMEMRVETRVKGQLVMQVLCTADTSNGDLVVMLEDAVQDLRWNIMQNAETWQKET